MVENIQSEYWYHSELTDTEPVPLLPQDRYVIESTSFPGLGEMNGGKVRDVYDQGHQLLLIATDRFSSFDRQIAVVPHSGAVANLLSKFWFDKTEGITDNHLLDVPDPNVTVAEKHPVLPIEVVVRGHITGVTSTSLWTAYANGRRDFGSFELPDGLNKNDPLPEPVITPTTKFEAHDRPLEPDELTDLPGMNRRLWGEVQEKALALFALGRQVATKRGLVLVDTKYEFGHGRHGLVLIDEVHTPDSSRYWEAGDYRRAMDEEREPENYDKEFLRRWLRSRCDPYAAAELHEVPRDIVAEMARRYIHVYERLVGQAYQPDFEIPIEPRIWQNLQGYRL